MSETLQTQKHRAKLEDRRKSLIAYLLSKVDAEDWHAVQDAGSDLRELDVELRLLK